MSVSHNAEFSVLVRHKDTIVIHNACQHGPHMPPYPLQHPRQFHRGVVWSAPLVGFLALFTWGFFTKGQHELLPLLLSLHCRLTRTLVGVGPRQRCDVSEPDDVECLQSRLKVTVQKVGLHEWFDSGQDVVSKFTAAV